MVISHTASKRAQKPCGQLPPLAAAATASCMLCALTAEFCFLVGWDSEFSALLAEDFSAEATVTLGGEEAELVSARRVHAHIRAAVVEPHARVACIAASLDGARAAQRTHGP